MFYLALFENVQDFFIKGGVFMAVLLTVSSVAVTPDGQRLLLGRYVLDMASGRELLTLTPP